GGGRPGRAPREVPPVPCDRVVFTSQVMSVHRVVPVAVRIVRAGGPVAIGVRSVRATVVQQHGTRQPRIRSVRP
ncbi:hypothetical protein, partial [Streptomyces sp. NPDC056937]|uniref:hypothetical protein n=1 Tax=Streptomyces sp. NPDC056937 TaxID=3345969 RepID=UPI003640DC7E